MAAGLSLHAQARSERGRHVRGLRRGGQVPLVLYGRGVDAQALTTDTAALLRVWSRAGRTHLVDLTVAGSPPRKVLFRDYQVDPRTARPLHADFLAVNLSERLVIDVPVTTVGESPAVSQLKIGLLQQVVSTLRVEALPANLPAHLSVDVSGLTAIDQAVRLRDVILPAGVTLAGHLDPDEVVVKVAALRVTVEEAPVAAEPAAAEPAAAPEAE
jgi:large subunit ribosomal protein L25